METEEVLRKCGKFGVEIIEIARWSIIRMFSGKKDLVVIRFTKLLIEKIPPQSVKYDYRNIDFDTKDLIVFKIKFYFKYSFNNSNFLPHNSVMEPFISGSVVFFKKKRQGRDILAYQLFVNNCHVLPSNFHKIRYSPKDKLVMNGNPLINKYIENQRNLEKEFEKEFY